MKGTPENNRKLLKGQARKSMTHLGYTFTIRYNSVRLGQLIS